MALDLRMKNGFRAISFKYSYVLDSYFIHRYIIIKYRSAIFFEYIGEMDSYFIHRYINIKYRSSLITDKINQLLSELWPLISV